MKIARELTITAPILDIQNFFALYNLSVTLTSESHFPSCILLSRTDLLQRAECFGSVLTGVARNFDWVGPKMEKSCDISFVTCFSDVKTKTS